MIPTLRRDRDDVFLIDEESLLVAKDAAADRDPDPTIAIGRTGRRSSRRPRPHRTPAALQGARGPALLGLAIGASALALLRPWGGGDPGPEAHAVSPRSPLISRSAAGAPAGRTTRVPRPAASPAEVARRSVVHHRSRRPEAQAAPRPEVTQAEPEREPTPQVAPVSSPAVPRRTEAASQPGPKSGATDTPTSPDPPPPSGGGPAGVESFGFER